MGEVGVANGLAALVEHPSGCKLDIHQVRLQASTIICVQSRQEVIGAMVGRASALHHSSGGHFGPTAFKTSGSVTKARPLRGVYHFGPGSEGQRGEQPVLTCSCKRANCSRCT